MRSRETRQFCTGDNRAREDRSQRIVCRYLPTYKKDLFSFFVCTAKSYYAYLDAACRRHASNICHFAVSRSTPSEPSHTKALLYYYTPPILSLSYPLPFLTRKPEHSQLRLALTLYHVVYITGFFSCASLD